MFKNLRRTIVVVSVTYTFKIFHFTFHLSMKNLPILHQMEDRTKSWILKVKWGNIQQMKSLYSECNILLWIYKTLSYLALWLDWRKWYSRIEKMRKQRINISLNINRFYWMTYIHDLIVACVSQCRTFMQKQSYNFFCT